jgi:hypothetical protein
MQKYRRQRPRGYDGTSLTSHHIRDLLPSVLRSIGEVYQERPDLILAAWPEVIGEKLAAMTQAASFELGILTVKVKNSTLYSLLTQNEKPRLLRSLRDKFPKITIKNILFRMG